MNKTLSISSRPRATRIMPTILLTLANSLALSNRPIALDANIFIMSVIKMQTRVDVKNKLVSREGIPYFAPANPVTPIQNINGKGLIMLMK